ncbi:MAG TPA: hypothetical protein VGU27_11285 [Candidatus Eisenbacteria bacterium]|nr:hypothetical protein [Candidatus Eisenbacteria bacterium]
MIFRSVAALVLAAGALILLGGLALLGRAPGLPPAVRHLRTEKDRGQAPAHVEPFALAGFQALPHFRALRDYAGDEERGIVVEGWVQRMLLSGDGDYHLEVVFSPRRPGGPDTAYAVAEVTPRWRAGAPAWSYDSLLVAFRPNRGGATAWDAGPRRVRLTGWLLYDFPYDKPPSSWSLEHGAPRVSGWELHPVTRIELWDPARAAWDEVRR